MQTPSNPKVVVIIPNRNGEHHLPYSLKALSSSHYTNWEAVLVDNASVDNSVALARKTHPKIHILENQRDRGFAGSVNRGIRFSLTRSADLIAVYSNDIKTKPDWISLVISTIPDFSTLGVVGFSEISRGSQDEATWDSLTVTKKQVTLEECKHASGPLTLYGARALKAVRGFDENYYMYGEDNDLHLRLGKAGFSVLKSNIPFWHYGEGYLEKHLLRKAWYAYRNTLRYALKNESLLGAGRILGSLLYQGCFPRHLMPTREIKTRHRPFHPLANFALFLSACLWNGVQLTETLHQRSLDQQALVALKEIHTKTPGRPH